MKITDDMTEEQKKAIRAKRREAQRKWRAKNKDKVALYAHNNKKRDPEKNRQKWSAYYYKHREELKAKARERWRAKHPCMKQLTPMYKGEPKAVRPRMAHIMDRDKIATYNLTKEERARLKELKDKLVALERLYNIKRIDLEKYIRERSILLNKIQKFDKHYRSDE